MLTSFDPDLLARALRGSGGHVPAQPAKAPEPTAEAYPGLPLAKAAWLREQARLEAEALERATTPRAHVAELGEVFASNVPTVEHVQRKAIEPPDYAPAEKAAEE